MTSVRIENQSIGTYGSPASPRRTTLAAVLIGNALEFYDFLTFSFFAAQISRAFFPGNSDQDKLLLTLATFGAGFLTRPIGAAILGRIADRTGRKPVLQLAFAVTGVAVTGVAVTPSYASIGVAAPLLVLMFRLAQGFALGGDVGAATAYLIEYAPPNRRGLYVSLQYSTQGLAVLAAGVVGSLLANLLTPNQLGTWGWRIAFLIGASIVPLGLILRDGMPEMRPEPTPGKVQTLADFRRIASLGLLLLAFTTVSKYTIDYMATYAQSTLKMSSAAAFGATTVIGLVSIISCPLAGLLSDRFGRRPIILVGSLILLTFTMPAYLLVGHFPFAVTLLAMTALLSFAQSLSATPALAAIAEGLPPALRSRGVAVLYALSITLFGGSTQFMIAWITRLTGSPLTPGWYLSAAACVGLGAFLWFPETRHREVSSASRLDTPAS